MPSGTTIPPARLLSALVGAQHASIVTVLRARVEASAARPFLIAAECTWTYFAAWQEILRFAHFLSLRNIGPGRRVASYLTNCPEALWTWFGTLVAGAAYVPLNPAHRGKLLHEQLHRSHAQVIVTDARGLAELTAVAELPRELLCVLVDVPPVPAARAVEPYPLAGEPLDPGADPAPGELASLLFTSGTTGRSKAVRLPHNMFCRGADALAAAFGLREDDVFHMWLPLCHIAGQLHATLTTIVAGGTIALFPTFSRRDFWNEVRRTGATIFSGLPNVLTMLLNDPPTRADAQSTLRLGIVGGAPPPLQRRFEERFAVPIQDTYGMSEIEPLTLPQPGIATPAGSCGQAGRDFEIAIVDSHDQLLPAGALGEIVARPRAPHVMMQGYEDDAPATTQAWRNLWFHTGDLGTRDAAGFLYLRGRTKHMIRRGGENVSNWELESLIAEHPDIAEVAVTGVPSALGEEEVKAVIVPVRGRQLDPAAIHAYCLERMARFMVPRFIEVRSALPELGIGKVERETLKIQGPAVWDALNPRSASG